MVSMASPRVLRRVGSRYGLSRLSISPIIATETGRCGSSSAVRTLSPSRVRCSLARKRRRRSARVSDWFAA